MCTLILIKVNNTSYGFYKLSSCSFPLSCSPVLSSFYSIILVCDRTGLGNFSVILKEKALNPMKLDDHNMNMVNLVYQIVTFAEKMVIMQINVRLKTSERHALSI